MRPVPTLIAPLWKSWAGGELLVVGDAGVTHIITLADFAGVAGRVVTFSFLVAVDAH